MAHASNQYPMGTADNVPRFSIVLLLSPQNRSICSQLMRYAFPHAILASDILSPKNRTPQAAQSFNYINAFLSYVELHLLKLWS